VTLPASVLVKDAFAAPESILHDVVNDVYLVSNVSGSPSEADDNGFISRVSPEGKVLSLKWIDGAQADVELHAPKGMAIAGDVLYVADLDKLRKFDVHTGAALGSVVVAGAGLLSDVTAAADGTIYFTDMAVRLVGEEIEHRGTAAVYKLIGEQARAVVRGKPLNEPNGVYADGAALWVVNFGDDALIDVKAGKRAKPLHLPAGQLDGIVKANDGRFFISSWEHEQIFGGTPAQGFEVVFEAASPADLGYDSKRNCLLIPLMQENALKLQPL
jgi:sugar lactone lactonase YvrE